MIPTDAEVEVAIAEFDAASWCDCFPQAAVLRDLLAVKYGMPLLADCAAIEALDRVR